MSNFEAIGLEHLCRRGGCLAKLNGVALRALLQRAAGGRVARFEDAAFVPLRESAILTSIDFGPLACSTPLLAGRIAALNAFSDIYASGGLPSAAMVVLCVDTSLPLAFAEDVLRGIIETCCDEEAEILGGQTITGSETLAGLATFGYLQSAAPLRKRGVVPGDALLLSKPIGTSMAIWAHALQLTSAETMRAALDVMLRSNRAASRAAVEAGVHAATDITGFGLLGHLSEMLDDAGAIIDVASVPRLIDPASLPAHVMQTAGTAVNAEYVEQWRPLRSRVPVEQQWLLFDPQTNGGLLVAAPPHAVARLESAGFHRIGAITAAPGIELI